MKKKSVVVTRSRHQSKHFGQLLEQEGFEVIYVPVIETKFLPYEIPVPLDNYAWIIFTSVNGVASFFTPEKNVPKDLKIAAVGDKTADAIRMHGFNVHFIPTVFEAETFVKEFPLTGNEGKFLLISGQLSRPIIRDFLKEKGIPYDFCITYETRTSNAPTALSQAPDYLTFTSPSTVNAFVKHHARLEGIYQIPVISIGTTTSNAALQAGFTQVSQADEFTVEGMVEKLKAIESS